MIKIRTCLFPAAGYGTRFLPATKAMPKEMMPIVNKPLIEYGVEEAYRAGMTDMAFVTGRGKRALEDHFDVSYELEHQIKGTSKERYLDATRHLIDACTFTYTRQVEMRGLGHAILTGEVLVGREPFAVVLADDFCVNIGGEGVLAQMMALFQEHQCSIVAIEEVSADQTHRYGIVAGDEIAPGVLRLSAMVEKPQPADAPSNLAIIGRYILTPDIFDILRSTPPGAGGEVQITDALMQQAKAGRVLGFKFAGQRFDCGSPAGYVSAINYCFAHFDY